MRSQLFEAAVVACAVLAASSASAQGSRAGMRFAAMDRNGDGVITRDEWRGSARAFEMHDWNGDGVLSGDEVRIGRSAPRNRQNVNRQRQFSDWTARGFQSLDRNNDNVVSLDEWTFDREGFRRADHNGDGVVTRAEFLNEDAQAVNGGGGNPYVDANRDGRISRSEWQGTAERFEALDANRDGYLSAAEMNGVEPPAGIRFNDLDVNRDNAVSRDEWRWSASSFDERDTDRDGRLSPDELGGAGPATHSRAAYEAGYQRGLVEGREAGREDRVRNQGWDLEGQRELETADSGYNPVVGPLSEYQAGYRDAFRSAYRDGWEHPQ